MKKKKFDNLKIIFLSSLLNNTNDLINPDKNLLVLNVTELNVFKRRSKNITEESNLKLKNYHEILLKNFSCIKLLYVSDCHSYTFNDGYEGLTKTLKLYNIEYLCLRIKYSQEYYLMKKNLYPYCKVITVPWILNLDQFKFNNKNNDKEYDLLFYGADYKESYPFRYRLKNLIKTEKFKQNFKIRIIERKEGLTGCNLFNEVSKAYLTFSSRSNFNYLVKKYFEIPLSKSFIIGNMPDYGYDFFDNNDFINIENSMTDDEIFNIIKNTLDDKKLLLNKIEMTYSKVLSIQNNNIHQLSIKEMQNEILLIENHSFTKDIIYIKKLLTDNINFILSYTTILLENVDDLKIFDEQILSEKYIYILKDNKLTDINESTINIEIKMLKDTLNIVCIENEKIFNYR